MSLEAVGSAQMRRKSVAASRVKRVRIMHRQYTVQSDPLPLATGRTLYTEDWERTEEERKVCKALEEVAQQVGAKNIHAGTSTPSPCRTARHL